MALALQSTVWIARKGDNHNSDLVEVAHFSSYAHAHNHTPTVRIQRKANLDASKRAKDRWWSDRVWTIWQIEGSSLDTELGFVQILEAN